jgi:ubiquitin carboxyl-terminal hydrolase 12/46
MKKLTHRVVFPFHLKLGGVATEGCPAADADFRLAAVVVHMGAHVNHGHYVALVRSGGRWVCFDDEGVHGVSEAQVQSTFGHTQEAAAARGEGGGAHADHAYILVYQRAEGSAEEEEGEGQGQGPPPQRGGGQRGAAAGPLPPG